MVRRWGLFGWGIEEVLFVEVFVVLTDFFDLYFGEFQGLEIDELFLVRHLLLL